MTTMWWKMLLFVSFSLLLSLVWFVSHFSLLLDDDVSGFPPFRSSPLSFCRRRMESHLLQIQIERREANRMQ